MSYVSESERERFRALLARAAAEDSRRLHSQPLDDGRAPTGTGSNPRAGSDGPSERRTSSLNERYAF